MTTAFDTSQYEVVSKPSYDTSAYEPVKDNFDSSLYEKVDDSTYKFSELSPAGKIADVVGGVVETIPGMVAGFAASAPAAVVGGWDALFGDKGTAGERYLQGYQGTHEAIAKAIPYQPETATGRAISEKAGQIFEYLPEKAGEKTYEKTGSPALATAAKTAVAGAELVLPFFLGRKKAEIPKETESVPITTQEIPKIDASQYEVVKPAETETAAPLVPKSEITNDVISGKTVYHGSPYLFDKFSMDKIGTGEGAQAYGHGLYFAENPNVASGYAEKLGYASGESAQDIAGRLMESTKGDKLAAIQELSNRARNKSPEFIGKMNEAISHVKNDTFTKPNIYKVDIPDSAVNKMLDWDLPLSQQSENIKQLLKSAGINPQGRLLSKGKDLVKEIQIDGTLKNAGFPTTDQGASDFLKYIGIPGIKYLDQGSRGAGQGTRNFVLFDENLAKIIEINGKPVNYSEIKQKAIETTKDLFPKEPKIGATLYSGIPIEEIGNSIKMADNAIKDKLGIPEPELKIETPAKEISLSPLDYAKSPRIIEKKFPEFAPFKEMADRSRVIQDTLRDAFEKRFKAIDESLGGGISKIKDFGKSYNENKSALREILLTEDFIGKRFSKEELVSEFKAKPEVINAHRLIRSALDHAYEIASKTRELRDKKAPEYRQGYVPHFFHDFFVKADGKIVGSAKTLAEATSMGNKLVRAGRQVTITPKQFEFPGEQLQAVLLGDAQYFKLKNSMEEAFSLKPDEASSIVDEMIHRRGRSRFVGNFLQRKGAEGWDKNLDYAIPHYLNMISRYAAMDRFKSKAISKFENKFGPFDKEYSGIAKYTKNYINDVLGVPTKIEMVLNRLIKDNPILNNLVGKYLGERPSLQIAAGANKAVTVMSFGFANISAGLVNLFQLQMGYTLLGARWLTEGIKRSIPIIKAASERKIGLESKANPDIGILRQLDVEIQQGLESPSGYSKFGELAGLAGKTLALWKAAEWENRAVVGLGAYYRGLSLGMTKAKAIEYARDVNTKVNFDYSVQDAPAIFRRSGPPGSMMLQFKKFPVKSIEFMSELKGMENARFWVPLFLVSGLYAFPGVEAVKNLVKSLFGIDAELEVKKDLMKWAGEDHEKQAIAKTIFYGAFANEELGGIDVSHRIGTGDFIPSRVTDFMGPFFSKTVRAIQLTSQGNVDDAIRSVSPGLGNPILAVTREKVTSPTNRDRLVTTLDTKERTAKAAGFRTSKEAVETDKSRIISYETQKYNEDKKKAIDDLIKAAVSKDAQAIKKTSDRIRELQIDITKENINREVLQKNLTASQRAYLNAPNLVKGKTKEVFKFK